VYEGVGDRRHHLCSTRTEDSQDWYFPTEFLEDEYSEDGATLVLAPD
jgi:hypothetical protein